MYSKASTAPPVAGTYRWASTQDEVDALPARDVDPEPWGDATIETYTVMHDRDGQPELGLLALLTPTGGRTWGSSADAATMTELLTTAAVQAIVHDIPSVTVLTTDALTQATHTPDDAPHARHLHGEIAGEGSRVAR